MDVGDSLPRLRTNAEHSHTQSRGAEDMSEPQPQIAQVGGGTAAEIQRADVEAGRTGVPSWLHLGSIGPGCEECDRKMATRNRRRIKRERDARVKANATEWARTAREDFTR